MRGLCVAVVVMEGKVRVTERRDVTRTGSVADARPFLVVWPPWRPREPSSWFSDSSTPSSSSPEESGSLPRSRPVLRKSIGRYYIPAESPRGSMRGKVVKKDGNFADERWPRRCEFHIQDRFVIDRFCPKVDRWSMVHRRHEVRDYEQRPWRKKKMLPC